MKIAYVGVPIKSGCDRDGVQSSPNFFRKKGLLNILSKYYETFDAGDITTNIVEKEVFEAHKKVKYLNTVCDIDNSLSDKVFELISDNYFPFVVGGDHALALGSISGVLRQYPNLGVIWFDAHGDYNNEDTSPSANSHGMPCGALMGWCSSKLNDVPTNYLKHTNVFWIGARDLDDGEIEFAKKYNLNVYSSSYVRENGMDTVMNDILSKCETLNIKELHCSFDIDAMDPSIVPGTGTKVDNGLNNEECDCFLNKLVSSNKLVSMDLVEYNRLLDDEKETTANWCMSTIEKIFSKI